MTLRISALSLYTACAMLGACSNSPSNKQPNPEIGSVGKEKAIQNQVAELQSMQTSIAALLSSEFADCAVTGANTDPLVLKICKFSKAAAAEEKVAMKAELAAASSVLDTRIKAIVRAIQDQSYTNTELQNQINFLRGNIISLDTRMNSVEAAIAGLQVFAAQVQNVTLPSSAMMEIEIGLENLGAGPVYESVLMNQGRTQLNAVTEAFYASVPLYYNALTSTTGSNTIIVAALNHDMQDGHVVSFSNVASGPGVPAAALAGQFPITVINANSFSVEVPVFAGATGSFGGGPATYQRLKSRGMQTVWQAANGPDLSVRKTSWSSKPYNFAILSVSSSYKVCYAASNANASIATISALGLDVVCK